MNQETLIKQQKSTIVIYAYHCMFHSFKCHTMCSLFEGTNVALRQSIYSYGKKLRLSHGKRTQWIESLNVVFQLLSIISQCRRGRDRMVGGYTTTYAISPLSPLTFTLRRTTRLYFYTLVFPGITLIIVIEFDLVGQLLRRS